jgi:hypothetical protein
MPASTSAKLPSFSELTIQVVRGSTQPLLFDEILRRVNALRPIDTNSPKGTIRSAIAQCRLIAPDGRGNYGWTPRMMRGARVRVNLVQADLKHKSPRVEIDDDGRELLWPGFFADGKLRDHDPIDLALPDGEVTRLPLDFFGQGHWGTEGSPELWR